LSTLAGVIEEACSADVMDTEPAFPQRKTRQQTILTSWQNISITILVAIVIRYWPEKPLNGYVNILKGTYQKQPVSWLHVVMPFIDLTLTEGDIPPAREHMHHK